MNSDKRPGGGTPSSRALGIVAIACIILLEGCTWATSPNSSASGGPSRQVSAEQTASDPLTSPKNGSAVDPQILSDVIDWAFPAPGDGLLRYLRVSRAVDSIQAVDCGGTPFADLDYTGDRIDQALFPDPRLIREKGLSESGPRPAGKSMGDDKPCRYSSLPTWEKVAGLEFSWEEEQVRAVYNSDIVQPLVKSAGECLSQNTGWSLTGSGDKLDRFFVEVDNATVDAANTSEQRARQVVMKYSKVYADCITKYAEAMRAGLMAKRPAAVERNRELLTRMAQDLATAGYVP